MVVGRCIRVRQLAEELVLAAATTSRSSAPKPVPRWCAPPRAHKNQNPSAPTRDPRAQSTQDAEPYNAAPAVASASEHGPSPSSREATQPPSLGLDGVYFAKTVTKRRDRENRCTCPNPMSSQVQSPLQSCRALLLAITTKHNWADRRVEAIERSSNAAQPCRR
jgi:hypothetical protein